MASSSYTIYFYYYLRLWHELRCKADNLSTFKFFLKALLSKKKYRQIYEIQPCSSLFKKHKSRQKVIPLFWNSSIQATVDLSWNMKMLSSDLTQLGPNSTHQQSILQYSFLEDFGIIMQSTLIYSKASLSKQPKQRWQREAENYQRFKIVLYIQKMNFLMNILSFGSEEAALPLFLHDQILNSSDSMPYKYYEQVLGNSSRDATKLRSLGQIVTIFKEASTPPAAVKALTIIFKAISELKFSQEFLDEISLMETPDFEKSQQMKVCWMRQLSICCKSYLMRLHSLGPLFKRAGDKSERGNLPVSTMISDLFLLINLLNLLFPFLTNTLNTIGRYYLKANGYFKQFYRAIAEHLLTHYQYIRFIENHIVKNYKEVEMSDLECFMKTVPEIEILCDKMEEALLNKYFKGRGPTLKIYFKEQQVEEIAYHIKMKNTGSPKDRDSVKTADEELLSPTGN